MDLDNFDSEIMDVIIEETTFFQDAILRLDDDDKTRRWELFRDAFYQASRRCQKEIEFEISDSQKRQFRKRYGANKE